jgi:hypothetical protein
MPVLCGWLAQALKLPAPLRGQDERSSLLGVGGGGRQPQRLLLPPSPTLPRKGGGRRNPYFANRYAPPFSTLRWKAGRACIRDSHALKFG